MVKQVAKQIESARRTQLAKGEVGIDVPEKKAPSAIREIAVWWQQQGNSVANINHAFETS